MFEPLLEVRGLSVAYDTDAGPVVAVDRVDIDVDRGEFLAIVGESGCGKSTLLFAIAQLLSPPAGITEGSVLFRGRDLARMDERALREIRWKELSVVMQSAMNALNPVMTVAAQLKDVCRAHTDWDAEKIELRSQEVFDLVGIDTVHLGSYPHQLSGGMRQRAMIAMALLFTPDLIIMDEPTSALDVVAQRSLMMQIKQLQEKLGFAVIFVTHDMSLVSHFSDRLAVMYAGQVSEQGNTRQVFDKPLHPYSRGLLDAFPSIRGPRVPLTGIPGSPPDLANPPDGCRFQPRCPQAMAECLHTSPSLKDVGGTLVRCLLYSGVAASPRPRATEEPPASNAAEDDGASLGAGLMAGKG
ncbi:MAG TPA: ABC transporter ATP-binding protein [Acidimicrobiales bacterium]|nr:ABC transporter ATP-binding protein [Acidimicrobiales bacterium]